MKKRVFLGDKYSCLLCDFHTSDKWKYDRHVLTLKHNLKRGKKGNDALDENIIINEKNTTPKSDEKQFFSKSTLKKKGIECFKCPQCNKVFKYKKWYDKHILQCSNMLNMIEMQNKLLQEKLDKIENIVKDCSINETKNITNNLTIQVFLNETCKDAINMDDFIKNIKVTLSDLTETQEKGYIKGVSNILIKNLETLKIEHRPIHCSDPNNIKFHVKTEEEWKEDNDGIEVTKAIEYAEKSQIKLLKDWMEEHPNWTESEKETNEYMKLIQYLTKNNNDKGKIIKEIANAVSI